MNVKIKSFKAGRLKFKASLDLIDGFAIKKGTRTFSAVCGLLSIF